MNPKISCILPVYNCKPYLKEAIESILNQTLRSFELVIVDDGSADGSSEIIDWFAAQDNRVKVVRQKNQGIVAALNNGIKHATGKYLARMDGDDISLPDRFEFQFNYLETHPNVSIVGGRSLKIDASGVVAEPLVKKITPRTVTDLRNFPPKIAATIHPLMMTRMDLVRKLGGYSDKYLHAEDYDIFAKLGMFGEVHNPEVYVLKYRVHGNNTSVLQLEQQETNAILSELDNIRIYRESTSLPEIRLSVHSIEGYKKIRIARRRLSLGHRVELSSFISAFGDISRGVFSTNLYTTVRLYALLSFNFNKWIKAHFR